MRCLKNPALQLENKKGGIKQTQIFIKILKKRYHEKKKRCGKVENFLQQVKQESYYICTICFRSLS